MIYIKEDANYEAAKREEMQKGQLAILPLGLFWKIKGFLVAQGVLTFVQGSTRSAGERMKVKNTCELRGMKYGKLDSIVGIDFTLPDDHPQTGRVLSGDRPDALEVRLGGTMWTLPAWKGKVYPEKTPQREMPVRYCEQFGCIELNATHYRIHPPETMRRWASFADEDFRFCPKFPQLISHFRRFQNCEGLSDEFIDALLALGPNCGPSFIQLPPNFRPEKSAALLQYIQQWPRELPLAIEFRHPAWFEGGAEAEEVWAMMETLKIGAVISDTAGRRDAVHMRCTAPFLLLRFGGNDLDPSDHERLESWADRIVTWHEGGLHSVYLLMHQPDSIHSPESCLDFAQAMEARLPVQIKKPVIQGNLFA